MADDGAASASTQSVRSLLVANLVAVLLFGTLTSLPWIGIGYCVFVDGAKCPRGMSSIAERTASADEPSDESQPQPSDPPPGPAGPPPATQGADSPPSTGPTTTAVGAPRITGLFQFNSETAREYRKLFDTATIAPERLAPVDNAIDRMTSQPRRGYYDEIEKATGVPWYVVAVIHNLEASLNIKNHLHNGDPLTERTRNFPAGRPVVGTPPFTWTQSAIDALRYFRLADQKDWELERALYRLELYNGLGSRKHKINTPYLWAFSNHYSKGKYVADGAWDADAEARQIGAAVIIKRMRERGIIAKLARVDPDKLVEPRALAEEATPVAPTPAPAGTHLALIIGNGAYQHTRKLKNAVNDATDVAAALQAYGYRIYGFPKTNFTRKEMLDAIDSFRLAAAKADVAVVWYAGHGQEFVGYDEKPQNMLIPVEAEINARRDLLNYGIPLGALTSAAGRAEKLRVVIVDACRDNNFPSDSRGSRGFYKEERKGMLIVYSTKAGQLADDGDGRNSPFAGAFLQSLEADPDLDVRLLFGAVSERMSRVTAQDPERIDGTSTGERLALTP